MASDYVDDLLRDERESFKRKETAAKKFDNRLDNFRKSAKALREAGMQFEQAFPAMSQKAAADKWAMTDTEKRLAFDAKGDLTAAPAERKTPAVEAETEPASEPAGEPETGGEPDSNAGGSDDQAASAGENAPQEPVENQAQEDADRPAWMTGNY